MTDPAPGSDEFVDEPLADEAFFDATTSAADLPGAATSGAAAAESIVAPADNRDDVHTDDAADGDDEAFSTQAIVDAMGGTRGLLESTIPAVAFAAVYAFSNATVYPALWTAVAVATVILVVALVQRRSVQQTVAGFIGIAFAAGIVLITGRARDFFLVGLWRNAFWLAAHAVTGAVRWPLVGLLIGPFTGEGVAWRRDPPRLRAYLWCTVVWMGVFGLRLGVQLPLFRGDEVVALGFAQILLGLPLFLVGCGATYLILRRVPKSVPNSSKNDVPDPTPPPITPG